MRPAAQVAPAHLAGLGVEVVVDGQFLAADLHDLSAALAADEPKLVWLARELAHRGRLVDDPTGELLSRLHDRDHPLLQIGEVIGRERRGHVELVVEAVLDRRADTELGLGERLLHGLSEHVRAGVAQDGKALGRVHSHRLNDVGIRDRRG